MRILHQSRDFVRRSWWFALSLGFSCLVMPGCSDQENDDDDDATQSTPACIGEGCITPTASPEPPPDTPPVTITPDPDLDGDGYLSLEAGGDDCNDDPDNGGATIHPGATEVCNEVDDNCDGQIDEGIDTVVSYADTDGDSFGSTDTCDPGCAVPDGCSADNSDCDDSDGSVNPAATEICNEIDDDCDDEIDEGVMATWYIDADEDEYGVEGTALEACTQPEGYAANDDDCDDGNSAVNPGTTEVNYDGLDNDCLGGDTVDADEDGYASDQVEGGTDCDDTNASINPGAKETGNGLDDNCNGTIDEGVSTHDSDGDCYCSAETCETSSNSACTQLGGGDCDDDNAAVNPGATEICNGVNDDCDKEVDEGVENLTYFQDEDGDGFGNSNVVAQACDTPDGYVLDSGDCNDDPKAGGATVYPGAPEVCDDIDSNCDNDPADPDPDADLKTEYYRDVDDDGWGVDGTPILSCTEVEGYADQIVDCDDTRASVNPDATEVCNGRDDDCDGEIDEGLTQTWYPDEDGDGYGTGSGTAYCDDPGNGSSLEAGDCNDADAAVHPGHVELCDNKDNDCDSEIDEDTSTYAWYPDEDGDGYGTSTDTLESCSQPEGYVLEEGDCNDGNEAVNPDAAEACDGVDNDCNDKVDEVCWDAAKWDEGVWGE